MAQDVTIPTDPELEARIAALESVPPTDLTQIQADIAALQSSNTGTQASLSALDTRISALETTGPSQPFRIFDEMYFVGQPDLGLEQIKTVYPSHYGWINGDRTQLPDQAHTEQLGADSVGGVACHDLEIWWDETYQIDWYKQITQWFNNGFGQGPVGHYGLFPRRDYWTPQLAPTDPAWDTWRQINDSWAPLLPHVSCLFPSVYTFYDDRDGWEIYARANVAESRRLAPDMPCYPFLWPRYHFSNATLGGQFIPGDYWRRQLDVIKEIADGVVLWEGFKLPWDDNAAWWLETQDFINS